MSDFNTSGVINKASESVLAVSTKNKSFLLQDKDNESYGMFQKALHKDNFKRSTVKEISHHSKDVLKESKKKQLTQSSLSFNASSKILKDKTNISKKTSEPKEIVPLKPQFIWEQNNKNFISANRDLKDISHPMISSHANEEDVEIDFSSEEEFPDQNNFDPYITVLMSHHQNEKGLYYVTSYEQADNFSQDCFSMHNGQDFSEFDLNSAISSSMELSPEEQQRIDDFITNEKNSDFLKNSQTLKEHKTGNLVIRRFSTPDIHIHTEQIRSLPYMGGSLSLTPLPMMQQTLISSEQKLINVDGKSVETFFDNSIMSVSPSESLNISPETTGQNQMNFGQSPEAKFNVQEQTRMIPTTLTQNYVATEFIAQIKEQFQKFQNGHDKKVTVHMRDGRKNLTLVMKMNNDNGVDLSFRTSDSAWVDVLEKNKNYIEAELNKLNEARQFIGIYYTGDE